MYLDCKAISWRSNVSNDYIVTQQLFFNFKLLLARIYLSSIHPCIQELFLRGENLLIFGYNLTCFGKKVFNSEKLMLIERRVRFRVVLTHMYVDKKVTGKALRK